MNLSEAINTIDVRHKWCVQHKQNMIITDMLHEAMSTVLTAAKEHETAMMVLRQIADHPRKTRAQILANSTVKFLASMRK